jgi:hypothetical protein
MRRPFLFLTLTALVLAGCERAAPVSRHTIAQSLKGVLVYPRSTLAEMSSGDSAGQLTLSSPDAPDTVAAWFRSNLAMNHWVLQNDARQSDGSTLIYAERNSQPLWINIRQATGGPGSTFTVTGAITSSSDSTRADSTQRSGSSMSSKRIQRR